MLQSFRNAFNVMVATIQWSNYVVKSFDMHLITVASEIFLNLEFHFSAEVSLMPWTWTNRGTKIRKQKFCNMDTVVQKS